MSTLRVDLRPGWQSCRSAIATIAIAGVAGTVVALVELGVLPGLLVALSVAFVAATRTQWAVLEGPVLHVRDARTAYAFRTVAARRIVEVRFHRVPLPWCRLRIESGAAGDRLVLQGPSSTHASLRAVTLWVIVHGRRRARIDPALLDALATTAGHAPDREPHDTSPA